jgi:nicotinate-nucleotide pyrophosphorylase (carboxylating)
LIETALEEDIGSGDITTSLIVRKRTEVKARLLAKENLVLAGKEIFSRVFTTLDPKVTGRWFFEDGDQVKKGQVVAEMRGDARSILKGERVALNFLQHFSGIASFTREIARKIKKYPVRLLDTRKTTPGLRALEKYAVKVGGGYNHRFGLFDGILIKENHIAVAGGIKQAVTRAKEKTSRSLRVEVEVNDLDEVRTALEAGADVLLLDNMDLNTMRKAVKMVKKKTLLEASGNINKDTVEKVAKTGVDFISMGALTHSAQAKDFSLEIVTMVKRG